jgi:hypothetical protein
MERSRLIVAVADAVLTYEDNDELARAIDRALPGPEAQAVAHAMVFIEAELGRATVERIRARHAAFAA